MFQPNFRLLSRCAALVLAAILCCGASGWAGPGPAREAFLRLIDRPRVPLAPEVRAAGDAGEFEQYHFSFAADRLQRVPGILIKPRGESANARLPVVISLHGTGGNKQGQMPLLKELAARGFLAVAIDGRYHGERTQAGSGSVEYNQAILNAFRGNGEHPFLYDTVWDVMRLLDYLETRPDVDRAHIGLIGFSKGGMETYLAAAVDPRVSAAVPCIGVQSFRWALDHDAWQSRVSTFQAALNGAAQDAGVAPVDARFVRRFYDRVAPGIYAQFDGPAMLPLIAPRPLLVINGDSDARTPRPGLMECIHAAEAAYARAGARDHCEVLLEENTAHRVTPEARQKAIEWFVRWLGPGTREARP